MLARVLRSARVLSRHPRMADSGDDAEEVAAVLIVQEEVARDEGGERVVVT